MKHRPESPSNRSRNGVILVVVLVLVVMMSLTGFAFMNRMATEYQAALITGDLRQAKQTLASAETFLVLLAEQQAGQPEPFHRLQHDQRLFVSRAIRSAAKILPTDDRSSVSEALQWRFSVLNHRPHTLEYDQGHSEFQNGIQHPPIQFGLENESGKLHLGRVMLWEHDTPGVGRSALMGFPGMTAEAADSILDWIDSDDQPREFGAEREHYSQLDIPYTPRNGLPTSIEELLFVKGVTQVAFYGKGQRQEEDSLTGPSWTELFTVHSAEPNKGRFSTSRINLNNVSPDNYADDASAFDPDLSFLPQELVKYILLARLYGISPRPNDTDEFAASPQNPKSESKTFLNDMKIPDHDESRLKEIRSLADLVNTSVQLPGFEGGHLIDSPLNSDSPEFPELMKQLEDRVTVSFDERHVGRININTATESVLGALLNDEDVISRIMEQRHTIDRRERESTAWLLTRHIVDDRTYRRIYPHITTRGAVHSGEIVVYRNSGGPFLRRRLIIDASVMPAQRVAWLDLTQRGLPDGMSAALADNNGDFRAEKQSGL
ncbi:MAG: type II secretion system protein GspK [Fuerstiella sp.]|nr:type II secretion system protein GspK [Fuerstiella sp.]